MREDGVGVDREKEDDGKREEKGSNARRSLIDRRGDSVE
jgi:hypothetical protein